MWKPDPDEPGMPAVDTPRHAAYDILVSLEQHRDTLEPEFNRLVKYFQKLEPTGPKGEARRNLGRFGGLIESFRVYALFPSIRAVIERDDRVRAELGCDRKEDPDGTAQEKFGFQKEHATKLLKAGDTSALWSHMAEIVECEEMKIAIRMITGLRADKKTWHGYGRKMVFVAKKPMDVAIFYLVSAEFDEGVVP